MKFDDVRIKRVWLKEIGNEFYKDCLDKKIVFHDNEEILTKQCIEKYKQSICLYLSSFSQSL